MRDVPPYPVFLHLARRLVLVVGGGSVAARKIRGLLEAAATVTAVSPHFDSTIGGVEKITAVYASEHMHLRPWKLVFAATHDEKTNAAAERDAAAAGILCCRCDDQSQGDFGGAAIGRAGPVTLAISTGGGSPALAARIRDTLQAAIDPHLAALAALCVEWRHETRKAIHSPPARHALMQKAAGEEMESHLRHHGEAAARQLFAQWLTQATLAVNDAE